jgi:protein-L-isoaspartate(D-aspartate) O-methyltransferase
MAVITPTRDADNALRRQVMIDTQLRPSDVTDPRVLAAFAQIDRAVFVPDERASMAYADRAVPLSGGRALNPALTTARMIVDLAPDSGSSVLLVGAATGYAAAVLAAMGVSVTAVEDDPALLRHARSVLANTSGVILIDGPMPDGTPGGGPYDAMLIEGCVEAIPAILLHQLKDGAKVVAGMRDGAVTRIGRAARVTGDDSIALLPFADIECVSLPGFSVPRPFQF